MRLGRDFFQFLIDIVKSRSLIYELTKKEFRVKYLGSFLGVIWAFIQPSITIIIFWFVFQIGFKSAPVRHCPFILWLLSGMVPWFFISESISGAAVAIVDNAYLVKKVIFRVSILPLIKILSALIIHLFFILVMLLLFGVYGFRPNVFYFQIVYYLFATIFLTLSVSWITSSVMVFMKDTGQIIGIILQFAFWMTPIFWNIQNFSPSIQAVLKLNPIFYIVEGYRNSLIAGKWFWASQLHQTIYFWSVSLLMFVIGSVIYKKLKPHFADVL